MDKVTLIKREQLAKDICAQLNNFVDLKNTLSAVIKQIREITEVEAVSVRLYEDGDYPYFVSEGFPASFIEKENSVLPKNIDKTTITNGEKPTLDCLCGRVIRGNVDKLRTYYTEKGSYWTNSSTDNTDLVLDNETDIHIRNNCNACGYESVGLFPIKTRDENIGLIQLNDKREGFFTTDLIEFLEMIGEQIGIAVENALLYEKLKKKNTELENTLHDLNGMQQQLMEAKKMTALADMVSGIAHEIFTPVSKAHASATKALNIAFDLAEKDTGYSSEINKLAGDNRNALKNIEEVQKLIQSFKAIAIDQFQESRQLINLPVFIKNVVQVIKPSLRGVDVKFVTGCKKSIEFMGFSGALSQVLTQLINNSCEHGFRDTHKGEIRIDCNVTHSDQIEIIYTDNGVGVNLDIQHKIFEPFFTTDRKNFSGLGLSIAHNLVQTKLKGKLEVSTALDEGVEFRILIPY